jgi:Nif-specific regulatory protein
MNPRLVAITGPLKSVSFPLTEGACSIGRELSNRVCLSDPSVSREHCLIKREEGQFHLLDLGSRNCTFVNGVPVKERQLQHGDSIRIGDSIFLFLLKGEEETIPTSDLVELEEEPVGNHATVLLRQEDALHLRPEKMLAAYPAAARLTSDLNALLKISTSVNSIRNLGALQERLLELIFEATPAERGAILLAGENAGEFASVFGRDRRQVADRSVTVSRTIVQRVLQEKVAVLSNDVAESEAFRHARSLVLLQTQSLLAVPLVAFDKALGVIYLDTSDPLARFDEDHLHLMTAMAGIAAVAIDNARHMEWLEGENRRLNEEINLAHSMVGESPRMRASYQLIAKVAPTDSTVLIRGESGTGKELAARAIHLNSPRAAKPFVAINCAALTETLLESELFGHEKGAFTGAIAQKKGKLEVADGGTVFLDELGETTPTIQTKLLRVLQEREFERVGGTRPIRVNLRLIAATNKDLEAAIKQGSFRQDLYYRLNVVTLNLPPLRERREDIPLLAGYFAAKYAQNCKRVVKGITLEARARLMNYDWPGNVRELENAIERAVVLGSTEFILPDDLPEALLEAELPAGVPNTTYHEALTEAKKQLVLKAFDQASGNYTEAARLLGMHPNHLHRLIRNLNLKPLLKK